MHTRIVLPHATRVVHSPGRWSFTALLTMLIVAGLSFNAAAQTRPLLIVSAGESYAAGEGAPDSTDPAQWLGDPTDGAAVGCHRSAQAAASDTANRLRQAWPVEFASVACSGSVTNRTPITWLTSDSPNLDRHHVMVGPDGQLSKIKERFGERRIDALVISIGGKDLGFNKLLESCMLPDPLGCYVWLDEPVAQELVELPHRLDDLIAAVNSGQAGNVRHVFVVPYPDPTTGALGLRCGLPHVPLTDGGMDGITDSEATWASTRVVAPLDAAIAAMVGRANKGAGTPGIGVQWHLVTGVGDPFVGHGYCAPFWDRLINTVADSLLTQGDLEGTMHPNVFGQAKIADTLTPAMHFLVEPQAVFMGQSVPAIMLPGQTYPVSVTMMNVGDVTWSPQDNILLGSQGPQDNTRWGLGRVPLPYVVEPGQQVTFTFTVTAPAQLGTYTFQWRMVQEAVQWFGQITPATSVAVRQMSLQIVQNSISATVATITVYARDAATSALLSGTVTLDGVVVGQLGQAFSYARGGTRVCETLGLKPVCHMDYPTREFQVSVPGYLPVSFLR